MNRTAIRGSNDTMNPSAIIGFTITGVIAVACLGMALFLRHGLPIQTHIATRMAFILDHPIAWPLVWCTWMLSALGLLIFCFLLRDYAPASTARSFGVTLVAVGIVPDISAELIFAAVLPVVAQRGLVEHFEVLELLAMVLTGVFGNGAYCVGGLVLNVLLLRNPRLPRRLIWAGLPAWIAGLALSVATFNQSLVAAALLTGVAMTLSVGWMLAVTLCVFRFPARYRAAPA